MSTSSILYHITIYRAHPYLSRPYKYSLRFSESGRILKQSIRQIKLSWSVNSVSEIFHSSISDTIGTRARRIIRAAALCCPCGFNIWSGHIAARKRSSPCDFQLALFQSVTKYVQHPLKAMCHTFSHHGVLGRWLQWRSQRRERHTLRTCDTSP